MGFIVETREYWSVADSAAKLRGLIVTQARIRQSEGLLHPSGKPNAALIAERMGISKPTVWRILVGKPEERQGVRRPRLRGRPSAQVIEGLKNWLGYHEDIDVLSAIEASPALEPFLNLD
jgi:hypothetical protein